MLPSSLRTIGESTFAECESLEGVAIPNGVTTIWHYAFTECVNLKSVVIPETVTRMGEMVFFHCDLDLSFWVEKGSYAEEWCRENGYIESMRYMDGSVPEDRSEEESDAETAGEPDAEVGGDE